MGHQRTRRDRSFHDGGSGVRDAGSQTTDGVWDADAFEFREDAEDDGVGADGSAPEAASETSEAAVSVDRGKLTDRQLEVLETAHEMGYYEYPRGANASEVAEALDICPSTLAEHLAAAQTKLLGDVLADRDGQPAD